MDRNFYQQKLAEEHQREISHELATRHLLKDTKGEPLTAKQAKQLMLRLAPGTIVLTILVLISFLHQHIFGALNSGRECPMRRFSRFSSTQAHVIPHQG